MPKPKTRYPLKEYEFAHKEPQVCTLGSRNFVIPLSYDGNVNKFIDDLFDKEETLATYPAESKVKVMNIDGFEVAVPYRWANKFLDHQKINRMLDVATMKYNSAIRINLANNKIKKENKPWLVLNSASLNKQFNEVMDFFGDTGRKIVHTFNKFITQGSEKLVRKGTNLTAKIITAPILLASAGIAKVKNDNQTTKKFMQAAKLIYSSVWDNNLIDKEKSEKSAQKIDKFLDQTYDKFSKWCGPWIKKTAVRAWKQYQTSSAELKNGFEEKRQVGEILGTMSLSVVSGFAPSNSKQNEGSTSDNKEKIEYIDFSSANDTKNTRTTIRYKITDRASFDEAFDASLPLIHRALLATEWFSDNGYSDNNNAASNTLAGGLWWFPEDYAEKRDPTSQNWEHTKDFLSKHPNITVSYEEGMRLTEGWYMHRNTLKDKEHPKTVVDNMYERLNGCELAPHELAAIASVYYNDEECGRRLCSFVRNNYKNPVACANYISLLRPKDKSFEVGIKKRHYHEALFYLNKGNYCEKVLDFNVCSGINSKGKFFITTAVTQLELDNFEQFRRELRNGKVSYETICSLTDKMCAYHPKQQSPEIKTTSIKKFLSENLDAKGLRDMTKIAGYYNKGNTTYYVQAMKQMRSHKRA